VPSSEHGDDGVGDDAPRGKLGGMLRNATARLKKIAWRRARDEVDYDGQGSIAEHGSHRLGSVAEF